MLTSFFFPCLVLDNVLGDREVVVDVSALDDVAIDEDKENVPTAGELSLAALEGGVLESALGLVEARVLLLALPVRIIVGRKREEGEFIVRSRHGPSVPVHVRRSFRYTYALVHYTLIRIHSFIAHTHTLSRQLTRSERPPSWKFQRKRFVPPLVPLFSILLGLASPVKLHG